MNSAFIDGMIALLGGLSIMSTAVYIFGTSTDGKFPSQEKCETDGQDSPSDNIRKAA